MGMDSYGCVKCLTLFDGKPPGCPVCLRDTRIETLEKAARWVCAESAVDETDAGRLAEALDALNKASGNKIQFNFFEDAPAKTND